MSPTFTDEQIADVKARADLVSVAQELKASLRRRGKKYIGSCPMCGGGARATRFEIEGDGWVCAVCPAGGDVIALLQKATGCSFAQAIERLGGTRILSDAEQQALKARREREERIRARKAENYKLDEIQRCRTMWNAAENVPTEQGLVRRYMEQRRIVLPRSAIVREAVKLPFFDGEFEDPQGRKHPRKVHEGPAMLAAFLDNDNQFCGLHMTWLKPDGAGKAQIADPETGEFLDVKKMRGTKKGSHLVLRHHHRPRRLFMAEGIETVVSVAYALHLTHRLLPDDVFWAAGDLGNLGGPHDGTVTHPSLKHQSGRTLRIPGPVPGEGPAIVIPPSVEQLILLGDGDSEPVLTRHALERGRRRYARPGLAIAIAMAAQDADFNDMLEEA